MPPAKFKTLQDIEAEQEVRETRPRQLPQQLHPHGFPQNAEEFEQMQRQNQPGPLLHHSASSPTLHSPIAEMKALGIPDDPSLHKLLALSVYELTQMRVNGHFDQATLLHLLQMKQKKEALMQEFLNRQRLQQPHPLARLMGPPHSPGPLSPLMPPHNMPVRLSGGPMIGERITSFFSRVIFFFDRKIFLTSIFSSCSMFFFVWFPCLFALVTQAVLSDS